MSNSDSYFQTRLSYEPERDSIWEVIVEYLQRYIPQDAVVLELGAGYCSFINQVKAREKHALDKSDIIEKYANSDVKTYIRNCCRLGQFHRNQFDVVFSSFLFEHLTRDELDRVMRQLRAILKPDGVIITLLPNFKYIARHYFDDYTHVQVFSHLSFSDYLTSQGFNVTDVQGRFLPYSFKSFLPKSAALTRLYLALPFRPMAGNMLVVATNPPRPRQNTTRPRPEVDTSQTPSKTRARSQTSRSNDSRSRDHRARDSRSSDLRSPRSHSDQDRSDRPQSKPVQPNVQPKKNPTESFKSPISETKVTTTALPKKNIPDKTVPKKVVTERPVPKRAVGETAPPKVVTPVPVPAVIRHGRGRRRAVDHYGVQPDSPKPDSKKSEKPVETFQVKPVEQVSGPINPADVRTRKKRRKR